jgi:hypothetical protein
VTDTPAPSAPAAAPDAAKDLTKSPAGPGDGLVRVGAVVFIVGAVATLVTVAPLFLGTTPFPTVAYLVSMLMAVGFVIAAVGVLRTVGEQRRQAKSAVAASPSASASATASPSATA